MVHWQVCVLGWRQRGEKGYSNTKKDGKKRKMCRRHHSGRTWEMSFIVTHTGVISDWTGADGLEENPCLEDQGKALKDLAHLGVRKAQTQLREGCGLCRQQDMEHGGDHRSKRLLGGMMTAREAHPLGDNSSVSAWGNDSQHS